MVRTQIQLTEEQMGALRRKAAAEGRSMAEIVRAGIDCVLWDHADRDRDAAKRRSIEGLGRFHSGTTDLGSEHDCYLPEAFKD